MKNKLKLSIIIGLIITIGWITVSESAVSDISSGIVRLHIIANSNSREDQSLKLAVRDRLLNEGNSEPLDKINLTEVEEICCDEITKRGYSYDVKACVGKFYFPTKKYENITLPAGDYNALKIIIGNGEGKNWWCVMYPPLCYSGYVEGMLTEKELDVLKENMKSDNYSLIENNEIRIKPSLKIVEIWQRIRHKD